jgi:methylated-DNA-protein-cysteine methyltransferase related protein
VRVSEDRSDSTFRRRVEELVSQIPKARVMSYGQIAVLCGSPRSARIVGGIAHFGNPSLPWHRVVNKSGRLASGYPGGRKGQKEHLEAEGIEVSPNYKVDIDKLIWQPERERQADE